MRMPVDNARITQSYKDPLSKNKYAKGYHTGLDFVGELPIYAVQAGLIAYIGWDPKGWGNYLILRTTEHDLIYAHLARITVELKLNHRVKEGQQIAVMGATGNVTGPHLHFEVRNQPWTKEEDVDPAVYLGIKNQRGPVERIEEMLDNLVVYRDGDLGAAQLLSYKLGCPMILEGRDTKYKAKVKHYVGIKGVNGNGKYYYAGSNRLETAKQILAKF